MNASQRLTEISDDHELKANESEETYTNAAESDADYKLERAKKILLFKAGAERMSQAEAETRADADEEIAHLYRTKVTKEAVAKAHEHKLRQMQQREASARTTAVDEREVDKLHANGIGGRR